MRRPQSLIMPCDILVSVVLQAAERAGGNGGMGGCAKAVGLEASSAQPAERS